MRGLVTAFRSIPKHSVAFGYFDAERKAAPSRSTPKAPLVGVGNDGTVIGIEEDFQAVNPQKSGRDSYELFLRNLLSDALGGEHGHSYQISFHEMAGREVCRIAVDPAPKPVYVKGEMYVRNGNQKRKLTAQEAVAYEKQRW